MKVNKSQSYLIMWLVCIGLRPGDRIPWSYAVILGCAFTVILFSAIFQCAIEILYKNIYVLQLHVYTPCLRTH